MHDLIEGIEVVADDFIVVNLKLNVDKLQLRLPQVLFIGYVATRLGLQVDPHKVEAIV